MTVRFKIRAVGDQVCGGCPQNWEDTCRAFELPHTDAEREQRSQLPNLFCYQGGLLFTVVGPGDRYCSCPEPVQWERDQDGDWACTNCEGKHE